MTAGTTIDRRIGARAADDPPLPLGFYIVFLAIMIPVTYQIGTLFMTLSRTVLLVVTPILLIRLIAGQFGPRRGTDILVSLFMAWFALAMLVHAPGRFVSFVGSNFLIMFGAYLAGRCYVRGPRSFRQMIVLYGLCVLFTLPFAIVESQTSVMAIPRWIEETFPGLGSSGDTDYGMRNGVYRVQVLFVHPIHYGLFCTMAFALVVAGMKGVLPGTVRWAWGLAIWGACYLAMSSGPFLGIAIQIALLIFAYLARNVHKPWKKLLWTAGVGYVILDLLSTRPAYFAIIERMTFNSGTTYGRRLILDAGIAKAKQFPVFGSLGRLPLPTWMTGSIDNQWLLIAVTYGIPAFVFLFGAYVWTIYRAGRVDLSGDPETDRLRLAWSVGTVGTMFTLATVAIWSELASLTFLVLGSGVWLTGVRPRPAGSDDPDPAPEPVRRSPYSRFAPVPSAAPSSAAASSA